MVSFLLVFLQFLLIALIAYPTHMPAIGWVSGILFASGLLVFALALWTMKGPTFTVMPEPKAGGQLVTSGIYGVVRHPMYLAVLLCAISAGLAYGVYWKWACCGILLLVLWLKLQREERMLLQRYAGYAAYSRRTKALLPWLL
jgi:protein-S-isoprenylcysteine O-methyltransferase Ste14